MKVVSAAIKVKDTYDNAVGKIGTASSVKTAASDDTKLSVYAEKD